MKNSLAFEILKILKSFFVKCIRGFKVCAKEIIRAIEDQWMDRELGISTCYGYDHKQDPSLYSDENTYAPTCYHHLNVMFDFLKLAPEDVLVDIGCGKGRVVLFAATRSLKKVIGIELREVMMSAAKMNLDRLKIKQTEVEIIHDDAATLDYQEGTVFFMYDPFGYKTFRQVISRLKESVTNRPRFVRLVYFNPRYKDYLNAEEWLIPQGEIGRTRIFVWETKKS